MSPRAERKFQAVLFDLLTALLDSWGLWNIVAGSPEDGRKWRTAYLRRTYETGAYRPYEALVAETAAAAGLSPTLAALERQLQNRHRQFVVFASASAALQRPELATLAERVLLNMSRDRDARII